MRKRLRLSQKGKRFLGVIFFSILILLIPFGIKSYKSYNLKSLGYDKQAVKSILNKKLYKTISNNNYSDTLNYVVNSNDFNTKYINKYSMIEFSKQKDLCKNINLLLSKGYTTKEISLIIKRGNNTDINGFVKLDYVSNISNYLKYDYSRIGNMSRYLNYYKKSMESYNNVVVYVNLGLDRDFYTNPVVVKKYSTDMYVSKYYQVNSSYEPTNLTKIDEKYAADANQMASSDTVKAFIEMASAASKEDYHILANSAYRDYKSQQETFDVYKNLYGEKYALLYAAKAGFSEHQTGLSIDVGSKTSKIFKESKEFTWMNKNAYKYGFILRYPKGKDEITGYSYESWHYRYVGKKIAKYINDNDITFDEYYAMFLAK